MGVIGGNALELTTILPPKNEAVQRRRKNRKKHFAVGISSGKHLFLVAPRLLYHEKYVKQRQKTIQL